MNKKFWIVGLVLVVLFGFIGCKDDPDDGIETVGRLTITGLDEYNGKYVFAEGELYYVYGLLAAAGISSDFSSGTGGQINNGSVTLNVWEVEERDDDDYIVSFNRNGRAEFDVFIYASASIDGDTEELGEGEVIVTFTNGVGTGVYEKY